ncbi:MAG: ChbG/HpnK family deacetylase [Defluviitaleaceae bacterium]|nr:ChbG/HpnK family deacetylase [Defluviitaleaceae bacterium]
MPARIITRADDAGSSQKANTAINNSLGAGFIKNVSLMACCKYIDEAASLMKDAKHICFGMHATLNAEWKNVKWGPLSMMVADSGLVDANGFFWDSIKKFLETKPEAKTAVKEYDAQLDRLVKLGFKISYVDSHMWEEGLIEGLTEMKKDWATKKGLLYAGYFKSESGLNVNINADIDGIAAAFAAAAEGQYIYVVHPSLYDPETFANDSVEHTAEKIARDRAREAEIVSDPSLMRKLFEAGVTALRYDCAEQTK